MNRSDLEAAVRRILAGEKATLVVSPELLEEAKRKLASLPAHLRERLTLTTKEPSR